MSLLCKCVDVLFLWFYFFCIFFVNFHTRLQDEILSLLDNVHTRCPRVLIYVIQGVSFFRIYFDVKIDEMSKKNYKVGFYNRNTCRKYQGHDSLLLLPGCFETCLALDNHKEICTFAKPKSGIFHKKILKTKHNNSAL